MISITLILYVLVGVFSNYFYHLMINNNERSIDLLVVKNDSNIKQMDISKTIETTIHNGNNVYSNWMSILIGMNNSKRMIYFTPNPYAGFSNNARAIRGLILFCLYFNRPLRSTVIRRQLFNS